MTFDLRNLRTPRQHSGRAKTVPDVETVECPGGGLHVLVNRDDVTVCSGCLRTWAELDREARG